MAYSQFALGYFISVFVLIFFLLLFHILLWNIIRSLFVRCSWFRNRISSPNVANKWINNEIHQKPCPMSPLPIRILKSCIWFDINSCINSISNCSKGKNRDGYVHHVNYPKTIIFQMGFYWIFYLPGRLVADPKDDFNCENPAKDKKRKNQI